MSHHAQLLVQRRLGRLLRRARKEKRLSLQHVAGSLGCSRQFVCDLERGLRTSADIRLWIQLAGLLEYDRKKLLMLAWQARGALALPALQREDRIMDKFVDAIASVTWAGPRGGYRDA